MQNTLSVVKIFDQTSSSGRAQMSTKIEKKTIKMIETILGRLQYSGIWELIIVKRNPAASKSSPFRARTVEEDPRTKKKFIRCSTWPITNDPGAAYEILLRPVANLDLSLVLKSLQSNKRHREKTKKPEIEVPQTNEIADGTTVRGLPQYTPMYGTVTNTQEFGAFVLLVAETATEEKIDGMIFRDEWEHDNRNLNMNKITQRGDRVKVAIIGVNEHGKIRLSRKYALECVQEAMEPEDLLREFVDTPNSNGDLSMNGYYGSKGSRTAEHTKRCLFLLEALAKAWDEVSNLGSVSTTDMTSVWVKALKEKYNIPEAGKVTGLGVASKVMQSEEMPWLIDIRDQTAGKLRIISDAGWLELGGPEKYNIKTRVKPAYLEEAEKAAEAQRIEDNKRLRAEAVSDDLKEEFEIENQSLLPGIIEDTPKMDDGMNGQDIDIDLIEEYSTNVDRMAELDEELAEMMPLIAERDTLKQWFILNKDAAERVKKAKDQYAKLQKLFG